jgi:hypothetical protein
MEYVFIFIQFIHTKRYMNRELRPQNEKKRMKEEEKKVKATLVSNFEENASEDGGEGSE